MNKSLPKILFLGSWLLALTMFLPSCTGLRGTHQPAEISRLSPADEQLFFYYYFEAVRLQNLGKLDRALEIFLLCYSIAPNKAGLNSDLGILYAQLGFIDRSEHHLRRAVSLQPQNWWYSLRLIHLLIERRNFDEAINVALALQQHHPYNEDVYFMLASLYTQTGQFDRAIDAYNQLERIMGASEALTVEKLRLFLMSNRPQEAINEIYRLIELFPAQTRYQVLLGDIYMEMGETERALEIFRRVLADDPQNPFVYLSLSEYYISKNEPEKARELIVNALKSTYLAVDVKMEIFGQHISFLFSDEEKNDEIEDLLKFLIEHYPLEERVHILYAVFLQNQERTAELNAVLETITLINPQNEGVWLQLIQNHFEYHEKVLDIASRAIEHNPETADFHFFQSLAFMSLERYQEARDAIWSAIHLSKNDQTRGSQLRMSRYYSVLGDIYYRGLNKIEEAFEAYEEAIRLNPNNTHALNNYAWFLAQQNRDLRRAERMSARTLEIDPLNSNHLSTYAWIFFRQGNYRLARFYIERSVANLPEDNPVIFRNYGDILYRTGDKEKALEMWKRAFEIDSDDEELKRRIETGSLDF